MEEVVLTQGIKGDFTRDTLAEEYHKPFNVLKNELEYVRIPKDSAHGFYDEVIDPRFQLEWSIDSKKYVFENPYEIVSQIKGIDRINGASKNVKIFLEEDLDTFHLYDCIKENEKFYLNRMEDFGIVEYDVRRNRHVSNFFVSVSALDKINFFAPNFEIKKRFQNIIYGVEVIELYLKSKYGEFELKNKIDDGSKENFDEDNPENLKLIE